MKHLKKKKRKKLISIPLLLRKCHAAWSICVRFRDKKCMMCGTTENLHAHHCLVPKSKSTGTRFMLENGIALCYRCHMKIVHKGLERKDWFDRLKSVIDSMVRLKREAEIIAESRKEKTWSREELLSILEDLTSFVSPVQ